VVGIDCGVLAIFASLYAITMSGKSAACSLAPVTSLRLYTMS
jgi:hypothetical protein